MKEIELYDILTLNNDEEYAVLEIVEKESKRYFLLSPVDQNEEPNFDIIKIVEEITQENKVTVKEVEEESLIIELSENFLSKLED